MKKNNALKTMIETATAARRDVIAAEKVAAKIETARADVAALIEKRTTAARVRKLAALDSELATALDKLTAARDLLIRSDATAAAAIVEDAAARDRLFTTAERDLLFRAAINDNGLFLPIVANAEKERARLDRDFSISECEKYLGLHFTTDHSGKMSGMFSLSSSPIFNKRCAARAKNPATICAKCFARKMIAFYSSMDSALTYNALLLSNVILPVSVLPIINALYFRFEAFGDLNNAVHAQNYLNIALKNSRVTFAWWSKNPDYIDAALKGDATAAPHNVVFIVSSIWLNVQRGARYAWINKVFTVYDNEDAAARDGAVINCGARHCLNCLRCYTRAERDAAIDFVNELLK